MRDRPVAEADTEDPDQNLSPEIRAELARLDRLAYLLDSAFRVPGTRWRFGLDAMIGVLPGIGDGAGALLSLYLIGRAWRLKIPFTTLLRMLFNTGMELVLGAVPLAGDLFDAWYKANLRNIALLKTALRRRGRR